jgi:hypothetical protein
VPHERRTGIWSNEVGNTGEDNHDRHKTSSAIFTEVLENEHDGGKRNRLTRRLFKTLQATSSLATRFNASLTYKSGDWCPPFRVPYDGDYPPSCIYHKPLPFPLYRLQPVHYVTGPYYSRFDYHWCLGRFYTSLQRPAVYESCIARTPPVLNTTFAAL